MAHVQLQNYQIIEVRGIGGFGTVSLALDANQTVVALKQLRPELATPQFVQNFLREADMLCQLRSHPHIVQLLDYGYDHGTPFLVMEYLNGNDVSAEVDQGPLDMRRALEILIPVAKALETAHNLGVIHCDVKPDNVRLPTNGNIKLMDFGIARHIDAAQRQIAGTMPYMAPELWRRESPLPATDVYALGIMAYELLTGVPPFVPRSRDVPAVEEFRRQHTVCEPDWTPLIRLALPDEFLALFRAMLAKEASARPAVHALRLRLESFLNGGGEQQAVVPVEAKPINPQPVLFTRPARAEPPAEDVGVTVLHARPEGLEPDQPALSHLKTGPSTSNLASEHLTTGAQIKIQSHLASKKLESDPCRAALVFDGCLYTGTRDGKLHKINLENGRMSSWQVLAEDSVVSQVWEMAAHEKRLLFHTGGEEGYEISTENGQQLRRIAWPEKSMLMISAGQWLYMGGGRNRRFYRSSWLDLRHMDALDLGARLTGQPVIRHGTAYLPTDKGLFQLDFSAQRLARIGAEQTCRSVTAMQENRIVAQYSGSNQEQQVTVFRVMAVDAPGFPLLAETSFPGQAVGQVLAHGSHIISATKTGQVACWQLVSSGGLRFEQAWLRELGSGRKMLAGPGFNSGLVAVCPSGNDDSILVVLNADSGKTVFDQPVAGEVLVSPLWCERKLCVISTAGSVEVFSVARTN